jgi:hypothetical protein
MRPPPSEIQRADPQARKLALIIIGTVLGLAVLLYPIADYMISALRGFLAQNIDLILQAPAMSIGVGLLFMFPLILFSIHLFSLGTRTVAERRSPPRDLRLARDTRIYTGQAAVTRGRVAQALAAMLLFACISLPVALWTMLYKVANSAQL